jgi:hypothetical protein
VSSNTPTIKTRQCLRRSARGAVWWRMVVLHPGTKDYDHSGQIHDIHLHPWSWHSNNVNRLPALTSQEMDYMREHLCRPSDIRPDPVHWDAEQ